MNHKKISWVFWKHSLYVNLSKLIIFPSRSDRYICIFKRFISNIYYKSTQCYWRPSDILKEKINLIKIILWCFLKKMKICFLNSDSDFDGYELKITFFLKYKWNIRTIWRYIVPTGQISRSNGYAKDHFQ